MHVLVLEHSSRSLKLLNELHKHGALRDESRKQMHNENAMIMILSRTKHMNLLRHEVHGPLRFKAIRNHTCFKLYSASSSAREK